MGSGGGAVVAVTDVSPAAVIWANVTSAVPAALGSASETLTSVPAGVFGGTSAWTVQL
jgi:hypothetical protein